MANRSYATLADLKGTLGITATTDDAILIDSLEGATLEIDKYAGRKFSVEYRTKYFQGANRLWVNDLLTVSTIKLDEDGNASFEVTLTSSDYNLLPLNDYPKNCIEVADTSDYGTFAYGIKKGVEIVGEWGYGDGESSSPLIADTTLSASCSTGATASVTSATNMSPGLTIKLDSEQAYIDSVSGTTLTLQRGINGTTNAVHVNATQIYIYQYPSDIKKACIALASALYGTRDKQGIQSGTIGDYSWNLKSPYSEGGRMKSLVQSILDDMIFSYKKAKL
jgi:hypothetical protein